MKLNRKGFSLIEMLAVVVILGLLLAFMIPNVAQLIEKNKNDSYDKLKDNIVIAAKNYVSDNRYKIEIDGKCIDKTDKKNVNKINGNIMTESKMYISSLTAAGYLTDPIINPKTNKEIDLSSSYVEVKYNCKTKDYEFTLEDSYLK